MANTQIPKTSTSVVLTLVTGTGAGTTQPTYSGTTVFNVWLGGTKVIPDTLLGTLPITVNGFTVSAQTNNGGSPPAYTSLSIAIAASSTLVSATGYILNAMAPGATSCTGVFDIPANWGYTVANAGNTSANGNYIPVTGANATSQGAPQYFNGTNYLSYCTTPGSPEWQITATVNTIYSSPGILYYNSTGATTTGPQLTGWGINTGVTAPAPTLTAISTTTAYTTSNAGTAAANGNYVPVTGTGATYNGATQYTNGTEFLTFQSSGPAWAIQTTVSSTSIPQYSVSTGATVTNIPLTGWVFAQGTAPAPTFTAVGIAVAAPSALTSFAVVLADSGTAPSPTLSWVLPSSGTAYTGFNVRRGTVAAGESATPLNASALAAGALSYVDTTAAYATDYYYVVDGLWASGTVTTSELHIKTDTAAPTSLAATFGNSQVALTWTNATGALGVIVERTPQGANTWTTITTAATPITSFTDSTVVNGTAYSFRIRNLD